MPRRPTEHVGTRYHHHDHFDIGPVEGNPAGDSPAADNLAAEGIRPMAHTVQGIAQAVEADMGRPEAVVHCNPCLHRDSIRLVEAGPAT